MPVVMKNTNTLELFLQSILSNIEDEKSPLHIRLNDIYAEFACHAAIKAGQILNIESMNALLREMEQTNNIAQCNHGRPTYVKITHNYVERFFERR